MKDRNRTEFWVVFSEILLTVGLGVASLIIFDDEDAAWTVVLLSSSILILKNTLYFTVKRILNIQKSILNKIDKDIQLEEVMKSYNSIQPELLPYAQKHLEKFQHDIKEVFARDKRTGKLQIRRYYEILYKYILDIIGKGNIWACSSLFDNEWDPTDNYEEKLMELFVEADKKGVKTNRIFIFKNEKLLNPEGKIPDLGISDEKFIKEYSEYVTLKNLIPYMIEKENNGIYHYPNTKSYVVEKKDWQGNKEFLGDGFCAFEYNDKDKKDMFIRDTSVDKVDDQELCGELLFDEEKIKATKKAFNELINAHSIDNLREYVLKNANANAKNFLAMYGIKKEK